MSFMTKTYNKAVGFTAISDDELYYINGGYDTNPTNGNNPTMYFDITADNSFEIPVPGLEVGGTLSTSLITGDRTLSVSVGVDAISITVSATVDKDATISDIKNLAIELAKQAIESYKTQNNQPHSDGGAGGGGGGSWGGESSSGGDNGGYTGKYGDCGL